MSFSNCFETLKLLVDIYKTENTNEQKEKHIIYISKSKCILVNAESIRNNFWNYHFYRGVKQSSYQYYKYMDILLPLKSDYERNLYQLVDMNDEIIKSIYSNNKKEEILDYIQKTAQITKIIEKYSEMKHKEISMNNDILYIDFNLSKIINPIYSKNKNITHVCKIMEKVKKTFRDFYHYNFSFFPIYELLFVNFNHDDMFGYDNHFLVYDHKILDKDLYHYDPSNQKKNYEYTEKIKITNNMIAKEYLQKRNIFASIIDFTACMIKHLNCFGPFVYQSEIIKIFCTIKHILELDNELKFIYIINILLENFHLLINEYHWRIIEQKPKKYEEKSLQNTTTPLPVLPSSLFPSDSNNTVDYTIDYTKKNFIDKFEENLIKIKGIKFLEEPTKILDFIYGNMNDWFCATAFHCKRDRNGRNQSYFFNNPYNDNLDISEYSGGSVYKYHNISKRSDCCIM